MWWRWRWKKARSVDRRDEIGSFATNDVVMFIFIFSTYQLSQWQRSNAAWSSSSPIHLLSPRHLLSSSTTTYGAAK
ncbi:hypothetical protein RSOLAG1IB_09705 [Rhizoctonia solani AG-1 IB]|uniref:Uncharacterized protein n=1 Tax=Thanatephorus cucumeris (strain AG1-IB / isolate 7/3/14) TaxID=1108050 RepID=A0A0B7FWA8_THACB|nr:hypothetical protein RSOLAG1IB_09705 [Rhizoctonia solani AG-1 IB]